MIIFMIKKVEVKFISKFLEYEIIHKLSLEKSFKFELHLLLLLQSIETNHILFNITKQIFSNFTNI